MLSAPPVPRLPRPVPRRNPNKATTIVAGFKCSDGMLLASDTLYSSLQRTFGDKLWVVHNYDPVVVFGGAGTVGALTRARREIKRVLRDGMSVNQVLDAIDEVLLNIDRLFPSNTEQKSLQAIVCVRTSIERAMFQNVYGHAALSPVDSPAVCLGGGYAIGDYFSELLYQKEMPLKWAKVVAAHLIRNCKTYAAGYCGGQTHLIEVPEAGPPYRTVDQDVVKGLEDHFAALDEAMRALLPGSDPNASDLTIEHRLQEFKGAVQRIRSLAVAVLGGAHIPSTRALVHGHARLSHACPSMMAHAQIETRPLPHGGRRRGRPSDGTPR